MGRLKIKQKKSDTGQVIGYFAYASPTEVYCDGNGCVIAGSQEAMSAYLNAAFPQHITKHTVKATTFEEIIKGIKLGAAYCLDEQSFARFRLLALKSGIDIGDADFCVSTETGMSFARVQILSMNK